MNTGLSYKGELEMKLASKTEYAVRAMLELAKRYGEGPVLSKDIARNRGISESYCDSILLTLRRAGLITSARGVNGGHALARAPEDIDIKEIVEVFEGSIAPSDCVNDRISFECSLAEGCVVKELWSKMYKAMLESIEDITLANLVERERSFQSEGMYYI